MVYGLFNVHNYFSFQINVLSIIGGNNGRGCAKKVINSIFDELMTPNLISTYTWHGRAKGSERKNPFKQHHNIHKLVFSVLQKVENGYSMAECYDQIKQKVLKYAYSKGMKITSDEILMIDQYDYE